MGIIIIGRLIASTLLILILLPEFYRMVYGKEKKEECIWTASWAIRRLNTQNNKARRSRKKKAHSCCQSRNRLRQKGSDHRRMQSADLRWSAGTGGKGYHYSGYSEDTVGMQRRYGCDPDRNHPERWNMRSGRWSIQDRDRKIQGLGLTVTWVNAIIKLYLRR